MGIDWESQDDAKLIAAYQSGMKAMDALITRYYSATYKVVNSRLQKYQDGKNQPDLSERLTQEAWQQVSRGLRNYKDQGQKFPNWVFTIAGNRVIDWYRNEVVRSVRTAEPAKGRHTEDSDNGGYDPVDYAASTSNPEEETSQQEQIEIMMSCIPAIPVKQRMIFLLRFESNLWDNEQPLTWEHLAQLNGIDTNLAWERFLSARDSLVTGKKLQEIDPEESLIFLVWTQANRADKSRNFTMEYFAKLLGESKDTLTTRYHAALKMLKECMSGKNQGQ